MSYDGSIPVTRKRTNLYPSPGAVGPASRQRRRYADAPAAALITGLGVRDWPTLRIRPDAILQRKGGDEAVTVSFNL